MAQFFMVLKLVASLIPLLSQMITSVEQSMPSTSAGAQKLEMVKAMLEQGLATVEGLQVPFTAVWAMVQPLITVMVSSYRAAGVMPVPPAHLTVTPPQPPVSG